MDELDFIKHHKEVEFIFNTFITAFKVIDCKYKIQNLSESGYVNIILHRLFAKFMTRYLISNLYDSNQNNLAMLQQQSLQQVFRNLLEKHLSTGTIDSLL